MFGRSTNVKSIYIYIVNDLRKDDHDTEITEDSQRRVWFEKFDNHPMHVRKDVENNIHIGKWEMVSSYQAGVTKIMPPILCVHTVSTQLEEEILAMLETQPYPPHDKVGFVCFRLQYM